VSHFSPDNLEKYNESSPALDKLAQLVPAGVGVQNEDSEGVSGLRGVKLTLEKLKRRAAAKYLTNVYLPHLARMPGPLQKSYQNSLLCAVRLDIQGDEMRSQFCKNRACLVCNRIRTAQLINAYLPILKDWRNKQFLTLTVPNVPGEQLKDTMTAMYNAYFLINKDLRKKGIGLVGLRKLECTYNAKMNTYHPHFHFIIQTREMAENLLSKWFERFPNANSKGQDLRPADTNSVKELFKYFTKMISSEYVKTKDGKVKKVPKGIYVQALDTIFCAMSGKRIFQPFGFKKTVDEDQLPEAENISLENLESSEKTTFLWLQSDWYEADTGEELTGYKPESYMVELNNKIYYHNGKPNQHEDHRGLRDSMRKPSQDIRNLWDQEGSRSSTD
jgi:hypothetical protein